MRLFAREKTKKALIKITKKALTQIKSTIDKIIADPASYDEYRNEIDLTDEDFMWLGREVGMFIMEIDKNSGLVVVEGIGEYSCSQPKEGIKDSLLIKKIIKLLSKKHAGRYLLRPEVLIHCYVAFVALGTPVKIRKARLKQFINAWDIDESHDMKCLYEAAKLEGYDSSWEKQGAIELFQILLTSPDKFKVLIGSEESNDCLQKFLELEMVSSVAPICVSL